MQYWEMGLTGGCLCGDLRYKVRGNPLWVGYCHCRRCQRHTGAPFAVFAMFTRDDFTWTQGNLATYHSSREVLRGFCPRCGSTLTFARPERNEINIALGTLDDPNQLAPQEHVFTDSHVNWIRITDDLPRTGRFPPDLADREPTEFY
jgi:hypothetical protein